MFTNPAAAKALSPGRVVMVRRPLGQAVLGVILQTSMRTNNEKNFTTLVIAEKGTQDVKIAPAGWFCGNLVIDRWWKWPKSVGMWFLGPRTSGCASAAVIFQSSLLYLVWHVEEKISRRSGYLLAIAWHTELHCTNDSK